MLKASCQCSILRLINGPWRHSRRQIEFPSILLPPDIASGSIVDITVSRNTTSESAAERSFRALQDKIHASFGAAEPSTPVLRCRNATQTSVVLEWDPVQLATADLISLALYRNGQKAGVVPRPLQLHSTKMSGLAVDTEYSFHLVLRTSAGTYSSERVVVRTHKMTDLSGVTITTGIMPAAVREKLASAVERIGAKMVDSVRIDTTHFVTTEGRGIQWEKAAEMNIPVVRPEWVGACEQNGRILGVTKFYLDALQPGPSSNERVPAQQPVATSQKDLPRAPQESPREEEQAAKPVDGAQRKEEAAGAGDDEEDEDDEDEDDEDGDEEGEDDKSAVQEEQKVRLDEKERQKFALRPGPSKESVDSSEEQDAPSEKPATPGDGASFQDVAL